ncbi:hypothetical protein [Paenibacillus sp. y28]|uniref:hypothetical protein n=1 Tax=Paenibacillus sp. y28 TaxID=3129110 RepID=UPI0030188279
MTYAALNQAGRCHEKRAEHSELRARHGKEQKPDPLAADRVFVEYARLIQWRHNACLPAASSCHAHAKPLVSSRIHVNKQPFCHQGQAEDRLISTPKYRRLVLDHHYMTPHRTAIGLILPFQTWN